MSNSKYEETIQEVDRNTEGVIIDEPGKNFIARASKTIQ